MPDNSPSLVVVAAGGLDTRVRSWEAGLDVLGRLLP
jgi:hypothetical protein